MKFFEKAKRNAQKRQLDKLLNSEKSYSLLIEEARHHFNNYNIERLENAVMLIDEEIAKFKEDDFPNIGVPIIVTIFALLITILVTYLSNDKSLDTNTIYDLSVYISKWAGTYIVFLLILFFILTQRKIRKIALFTRLKTVANIKIAEKKKKNQPEFVGDTSYNNEFPQLCLYECVMTLRKFADVIRNRMQKTARPCAGRTYFSMMRM